MEPIKLSDLLQGSARGLLESSVRTLGVDFLVVDAFGVVVVGEGERKAMTTELPIELGGASIGTLAVRSLGQSLDEYAIARHLQALIVELCLMGQADIETSARHTQALEQANSELRENNRRLAAVVKQLENADRMKSAFLATVSHELRTPLTSVIGYSEMLLEGLAGDLTAEQRDYVRTVMDKADQLLQIITGILDISRMEAGEMRFELERFDVAEVVSVALSTMAPTVRRKRLMLTAQLAENLPKVFADRKKVRQVLLNLLGNAAKFTPENGQVRLSVETGTLARDGQTPGVRIAVSDSGIGVAPDHHARLFEPFFQVDNTATREYGGTGLGLSIVKRFVEGMGGHVWVESDVGQGATFVFTLPMAEDAA